MTKSQEEVEVKLLQRIIEQSNRFVASLRADDKASDLPVPLETLLQVHETIIDAYSERLSVSHVANQYCLNVLESPDTSISEGILACQLLLRQNPTASTVSRLNQVALPLLLTSKNVDSGEGSSVLHFPLVREAMLEICFAKNVESNELPTMESLDECIKLCSEASMCISDKSKINPLELVCQTLSRLYDSFVSYGNEAHLCAIMRAIHMISLRLLFQATTTKMTSDDQSWKYIMTYFIPILYGDRSAMYKCPRLGECITLQKQQTQQLWSVLRLLLQPKLDHAQYVEQFPIDMKLSSTEQPSAEKGVSLVFGVLCMTASTFSSILQINDDLNDAFSTDPILWNAILETLRVDRPEVSRSSDTDTYSENANIVTRRRALHVLHLIIENQSVLDKRNSKSWNQWKNYVASFEAFEMEMEQHLVNQVWPTLRRLVEATTLENDSTNCYPPTLTWTWIGAILSRLLAAENPKLRKLALHRLFHGDMGIHCTSLHPPKSLLPATCITVSFVIHVLLPAYDGIGNNSNVMYYEDAQKTKDAITLTDLEGKLKLFLKTFISGTVLEAKNAAPLMEAMFSRHCIMDLRASTVVLLMESIREAAEQLHVDHEFPIPLTDLILEQAVDNFKVIIFSRAMIQSYKTTILEEMSWILRYSISAERRTTPNFILVLRLLSLYRDFNKPNADTTMESLAIWLQGIGPSLSWCLTVGAASASSFVTGDLSINSESSSVIAESIVRLCKLASLNVNDVDTSSSNTASSCLWPAIHKGFRTASGESPNRALLLLQHGCVDGILGGMGNGDLIITNNEDIMMPPPPAIEELLLKVCTILNKQLEELHLSDGDTISIAPSSSDTKLISAGAARMKKTMPQKMGQIGRQLLILARAYPSSATLSSFADSLASSNLNELLGEGTSCDVPDSVKAMCCLYAALLSGGDVKNLTPNAAATTVCIRLLNLDYTSTDSAASSKHLEQSRRSTFHYAKWGALSILMPKILAHVDSEQSKEISTAIINSAIDSVSATPLDALFPLFETALAAACHILLQNDNSNTQYPSQQVEQILGALTCAMRDMSNNQLRMKMLENTCSLLFRSKLLHQEYHYSLQHADADLKLPIRNAFRDLIAMAGIKKPHIAHIALSKISSAWIGTEDQGCNAIPYRDDIVSLLLYKECKPEAGSSLQEGLQNEKLTTVMTQNELVEKDVVDLGPIPKGTHDQSVARAFTLLFLANLPKAQESGGTLSETVLTKLLHHIILKLLALGCSPPIGGTGSLLTGSAEYSEKIRSWQALCVLQRFVTKKIAHTVISDALVGLQNTMHGQIRYFAEIFVIQVARRHPVTFSPIFLHHFQRSDLSLQHGT